MDDHHPTPAAPATAAQVDQVLAVVASTYRATTDLRRRMARIVAVVGLVFALMAVVAAVQWQQAGAAVDEVRDEALIDVLGVQIPDPRPAVERTGLRIRAVLWGAGAFALTALALLAGGIYLLVRPTRLPPEVETMLHERSPTRPAPENQP